MEDSKENTEHPNELDSLKQRADIMGINYHPNIGVDKLKEKIAEKTTDKAEANAETDPDVSVEYAQEEVDTIKAAEVAGKADVFTPGKQQTASQISAERSKEATRLVRVRVSNMNPLKGSMLGEIFSVGNSKIGFLKKYVPFNAEAGWHVPHMIVQHMREKKFLSHFEVKVNGKKVNKHKLIPEYAIEIMTPLTEKEIHELKQRQLMAAAGVE